MELSTGAASSAAIRLLSVLYPRLPMCRLPDSAPASLPTPPPATQVAVDLATPDGRLRMRSNASSVASPGFLTAYFDPSVITGEEGGSAGLAAGEAEEEALALEELEEDEGLGSTALRRRAQQEAERAAAADALAALQKGDQLSVVTAEALEHETRPPPRYTEGGWGWGWGWLCWGGWGQGWCGGAESCTSGG